MNPTITQVATQNDTHPLQLRLPLRDVRKPYIYFQNGRWHCRCDVAPGAYLYSTGKTIDEAWYFWSLKWELVVRR